MAIGYPSMRQVAVTYTNGTSSGSNQALAAAQSKRVYIEIINTSDTVMYLNFGAAATNTKIPIAPGATWRSPPNFCPTNSVNVLGTSTKTYLYAIVV